MTKLSYYIKSFLRLHGELASKIKLSPLGEEYYRLIIFPDGPLQEFLPDRISNAIKELIVKTGDNCDFINLGYYPNLRRLILESSTDTTSDIIFRIAGCVEIHTLELDQFHVSKVIVENINLLTRVHHLNISTTHFFQLDPDNFYTLHSLSLNFSSNPAPLDLSKLQYVTEIQLKGKFAETDNSQFSHIKFPSSLRKLHLNYMVLDQIELDTFPDLLELKLTRLKNLTKQYAPRIIWQTSVGANKLKYLRIDGLTFEEPPIIFDGLIFTELKELEFENHMNKEIRLLDLEMLRSFKTNISRYVVGHNVNVYLVNCPNLSRVRTSHRINKYIWKSPIEHEFAQNVEYLGARPEFD